MGKYGHSASLTESGASTCVASNSDFSPKWIEQAQYAESDAPQLNHDSTLKLDCTYRSSSDSTLGWAAEGDEAVWGLKERCQALVFYYEQ